MLNGATAFRYELSKTAQASLMARLGIRHPATRVLNRPEQAMAAADGLRFPVLVKPNIGGSGAGIASFATCGALEAAVMDGELSFGIDHVGLLQEHLPASDDAIVRIEILDGRFLYAIRLLCSSSAVGDDSCSAGTSGSILGVGSMQRFASRQALILSTNRSGG